MAGAENTITKRVFHSELLPFFGKAAFLSQRGRNWEARRQMLLRLISTTWGKEKSAHSWRGRLPFLTSYNNLLGATTPFILKFHQRNQAEPSSIHTSSLGLPEMHERKTVASIKAMPLDEQLCSFQLGRVAQN